VTSRATTTRVPAAPVSVSCAESYEQVADDLAQAAAVLEHAGEQAALVDAAAGLTGERHQHLELAARDARDPRAVQHDEAPGVRALDVDRRRQCAAVPLGREQPAERPLTGVAAHRRLVVEQRGPQRCRPRPHVRDGAALTLDRGGDDGAGRGAQDERRRGGVEAAQHLVEEGRDRLGGVHRTGQRQRQRGADRRGAGGPGAPWCSPGRPRAGAAAASGTAAR
jgi:hypothetical protein